MFSDENGFKIEISEVYTEHGECRCCMAKGHHRDLHKEYYFNNIREVYQDIFMDCFNLPLTTENHISSLICMNCVQRLRDATSFRMMVVSTERQLLKAIPSNNIEDTLFINVPGSISVLQNITTEIKTEIDAEDVHIEPDIFKEDLGGNPCGEGGDTTNDDQDVKEFDFETDSEGDNKDSNYTSSTKEDNKPLEPVEGESKLLARFTKPPHRLPKCSNLLTICPEYADHLKRLKDSTMEISPNPEESSNAVTVQVDVHHRHCSQLSASVATSSHVCVNETQATSDVSSIRPGYPKTAAERMREYRARKKKETLTVNHQKQKKSAAERVRECRIRKKLRGLAYTRKK